MEIGCAAQAADAIRPVARSAIVTSIFIQDFSCQGRADCRAALI
jgi:hypothetical protein